MTGVQTCALPILYHFTDCSLNLAILVSLYVPDGPNIITITASVFAANTAFSGIIYFVINFIFYHNLSSECVTR